MESADDVVLLLLSIVPGHFGVAEIDAAERKGGEPGRGVGLLDPGRGLGLLRLLGTAGLGQEVVPVGLPGRIAGEVHDQPGHGHRVHLDLLAQERQERDMHACPLRLQERVRREARGVTERERPEIETQPRKDRKPDVAAEVPAAAGLPLDQRFDLVLVVVGIEHHRHDDDGGHDRRHEEPEQDRYRLQYLFQDIYPRPRNPPGGILPAPRTYRAQARPDFRRRASARPV